MKSNLIILILIFAQASFSFAQQTENQRQIVELEKQIEQEAANSNFKQAARMQEELVLRQQLEEAIKVDSIHKAGDLQKKIRHIAAQTSMRSVNHSSLINKAKERNAYFYIDFATSGVNFYDAYYEKKTTEYIHPESGYNYFVEEEGTTRKKITDYAIGLQFGQHFFFSSPEIKKPNIGFTINYLGVGSMRLTENASGINYYFLRPGLIVNLFLTPDLGLDFTLYTGSSFLDIGSTYKLKRPYALSASPQIKFWYRKLNVGVQYNYVKLIYNPGSLNNLSFTVGLKL